LFIIVCNFIVSTTKVVHIVYIMYILVVSHASVYEAYSKGI